MYKVLLVDDERIILEGVSRMVDWGRHGSVLAGTARNGVEAYDWIVEHRPDIVISDIRMPGLDGLQLVDKVKEHDPLIPFILLSGFDEFEYARKAMRYGVKHYLLKPCNEEAIAQALSEVVEELRHRENKEQFRRKIEVELRKVLPHVKEQFLKEMVSNKTYGARDWDDYRQLLRIPPEQQQARLLLFQPEGAFEYEYLFALKNIATDILGADTVLLGTTLGKHALLLIRDSADENLLFGQVETIKATFLGFYKMDATVAMSRAHDMAKVRTMYRETLECLNYRFYLGEGSLITPDDCRMSPGNGQNGFAYDEDRLCMLVQAGRWEDTREEIGEYFDALSEWKPDTDQAKSYVLSLYAAIVRQCDAGGMSSYLRQLSKLEALDTLQSLRDFLETAAREITLRNYKQNKSQHSAIIGKVLEVINANLSNPQLSLLWVAQEILYMNADYLGKLFKKEIGDKFSTYVMKRRMEKAMERIAESEDVKMFELADELGYGDNPQYFSQVFKKYTGCTPTEYKRTP